MWPSGWVSVCRFGVECPFFSSCFSNEIPASSGVLGDVPKDTTRRGNLILASNVQQRDGCLWLFALVAWRGVGLPPPSFQKNLVLSSVGGRGDPPLPKTGAQNAHLRHLSSRGGGPPPPEDSRSRFSQKLGGGIPPPTRDRSKGP